MLMTDVRETCMRNSCELTCARNLYVCHTDLQHDFSRVSFSYKFLVRLSWALAAAAAATILHCRVVPHYSAIHRRYFPLLLIYLAAGKKRDRERKCKAGKSIIQSRRAEKRLLPKSGRYTTTFKSDLRRSPSWRFFWIAAA